MNIRRALKELGFDTVDSKFYSLIDVWKSWYDGDVKDFHSYTVWNGIEELECHRYSVNMGKKVCEDWANLLMNERVNITLEGKKEQEFVDAVLADNNWEVKSNELQERKSAVGTVAYVPIMEDMSVDPDTAEIANPGRIHINYVTAANIYPLTWYNGIIRECAFAWTKRVDDAEYTYIQVHRLNGGEYDIENYLYDAEEVPLTSVRGFEAIPPVVRTGSAKPQFVIDRLNIANSDEDNPMGVAVFASAIDQLKSVDITYDSYVNEFVLGKKRIVVQPEATKDINGRPVFDKRETVYYVLPEDRASDGNILQQVDMTLRTAEFNTGMQDMDWQQDFPLIVAPVNKVLGEEVRAMRYLHWWTWNTAYTEIGDCMFAQVVNIRRKKSKGEKLDKSEQEFYRKNRHLIDFQKQYTEQDEAVISRWI